MTIDRFTVIATHLSPDYDRDKTEAHHPVGASHLKEYLAVMYGPDVPNDRATRYLTDRHLDNLAALSIDERMRSLTEDSARLIPHWLSLLEPAVDSGRAVGKQVNTLLDTVEKHDPEAFPTQSVADLRYSSAVFHITGFIIATDLCLPHPHFAKQTEGSKSILRGVLSQPGEEVIDNPDEDYWASLATSGIVKAEYGRKMLLLQKRGRQLIIDSERYVERLRELATR